MIELLAPAGSMESLKAAIANGADAVYLGMQRFGARAYSANFDEESVAKAVSYAHLRGVKVYVTMNTIAFENELADVRRQLHFLNGLGADGIVAQDLAVLTYVARNFEDMEAHCSTQMGIDDLEGALLAKELGAKRIVIAREVGIERAKEIRKQANIAIEAFVHGALCISYSGNCIMSSMTGNRSGNRGRCIGSCRKLYDVVDVTDRKADDVGAADAGNTVGAESTTDRTAGIAGEVVLGRNYILSTKDLNTIDHVDQLKGIDSLKIEGRMKEPVYVANVVSRYRMALDGEATREDKDKLSRTFNRTYTKGYLFGEDRKDITNVEKPNHHGYRIGSVAGFRKGMCEIKLTSPLRQNDLIRIRHGNEDINLSAAKIFDRDGRLVNGADSVCYLKIREKLSPGDAVFKTKDIAYEKELEARLEGEFRRFPLDMTVHAYPEAPLIVEAEGLGGRYVYEGNEMLSEALKQPTTKDAVIKQLARLNETIFTLGNVDYEDYGAFIPAKMLNTARKEIVEQLYAQCIERKPRREKEPAAHEPICFEPKQPFLCASVATQEQYDACRECGLETVYFQNIVPRNGNADATCGYYDREGELLLGGMGGIQRYRYTNPFITDYSLNIVNSKACYELHRLGAKRVTLSYEINEHQLHDLLDAYRAENGGLPALEMIVYGRAPLLVTKYCPLKKMGQCGQCKTRRYEIRDDFGTFPLLSHDNCDTTVLNGKILNLLDELPKLASIGGIEAFRLNFTLESADEVREVVAAAQAKLDAAGDGARNALDARGATARNVSAFNSQTDTRGYFHKEIL